jgi:hypothetical protein
MSIFSQTITKLNFKFLRETHKVSVSYFKEYFNPIIQATSIEPFCTDANERVEIKRHYDTDGSVLEWVEPTIIIIGDYHTFPLYDTYFINPRNTNQHYYRIGTDRPELFYIGNKVVTEPVYAKIRVSLHTEVQEQWADFNRRFDIKE